ADRGLSGTPGPVWCRSSIGTLFWKTVDRVHRFGRGHVYCLRADRDRRHLEHPFSTALVKEKLAPKTARNYVKDFLWFLCRFVANLISNSILLCVKSRPQKNTS